jgi:small multidrug resistance pump
MQIFIIIGLAAIGVLGDYFLKLAGTGQRYIVYSLFLIGMVLYSITAVGWFYVMKHIKLGTLGLFYSLTTVILLLIVGAVFFKEELSGYDLLGIILGVASIIILSRAG